MNFVVIGGDAAGMSAASRAKRLMPDMNVTVLEKNHDVSFSACGMPYNIAVPEKPIEDLVVRQADVFREKQGINLQTGHEVTKIDPAEKKVSVTTDQGTAFTFPYDKLLIATGGSPVTPNFAGADLPGVFSLKILDNGRKMKAWLNERPVKKVVIIGTGYIGLEMCESLRERGLEVDMVKPGKALVSWTAPELSDTVQQEVESRGGGGGGGGAPGFISAMACKKSNPKAPGFPWSARKIPWTPTWCWWPSASGPTVILPLRPVLN